MKFLDEYRNEALAQKLVTEIRRVIRRPWVHERAIRLHQRPGAEGR